ncbi:peptidase C19, ubiquitin C-terminal hydrolase 2 [Suhomyces tanzawaensis NRRL Y-17324]|uniref:ubiquitinyl hydrolase 1 n=1 Tax=Suhomyces tanzawaensis NRRL Y-17324 TaxID=984487 RepID=A0A1E4SNG3_9ASCO|nr:peptidase C19, ubiquitin C-terminal hydrolase 2 [Suhomyces tanzawaensis NRRL Y-17324]ODV81036.1 peptidase C19, ubiquitin C-terminal hydrolase 2 [Suhomyces tanzawaensis NRRL Y-17324]
MSQEPSGESSKSTTPPSSPSSPIEPEASDSEVLKEVTIKRLLIQELLQNGNTGKEGDLWYLISADYLDRFLNLEVTSFEDLKTQLGPFDCSSIVDVHGNLYPENDEPIGTYNVSPEIFESLSSWLGVKGNPVTRCLIINDATATKEVERYPPVFYIHQLVKKPNSASSSYGSGRYSTPPTPISVSRTRTFQDLFDLIRVNVLKAAKNPSIEFRVWFIDSKNILDYQQNISLVNFIYDIPNKRLVLPNLLNQTLKSQGIESSNFHLLVESSERKNTSTPRSFPVDSFLSLVDLTQYDLEDILSKGGNLGLNNLGNTCYMNSALQCLVHIPEINYYFFYNMYKKELNFDNPLGNKGDVANSFGSLLKLIFESPSKSAPVRDRNSSASSSIAPREFKSTIGRYSSMFSGYLQQDSQEFLSWLLDALHEDLNRIHKKPYCEKPELKDEEMNDPNALVRLAETCWNQHKLRNDSVIVDLFTGMYESTLICPICSKTSITFDPFNDLTLPLPVSKMWYHTFTIIDLSDDASGALTKSAFNGQKIMKLEVELNKRSNFDDLLKYFSKFLGVDSTNFFLYEVHQNTFYTDFQLDYTKNKFMPIGDIIRDSDDILVYYIPHDPVNDIIIPVLNSVEDPDKSYKITELFGIPLFIKVNKDNEVSSFGTIRRKLEEKLTILTKHNLKAEYDKVKSEIPSYEEKKFYSPDDFPSIVSIANPSIGNNEDKDNEDEGYNSDVSLASPFVSANLGFTIKSKTYDQTGKPNDGYRRRFNFGYGRNSKVDRTINVPLYKPNLGEFKPMVDELPELKRKYYYYSDCEKNLDQEMEDLAVEVNKNLAEASVNGEVKEDAIESESNTNESDKTTDGFVIVDRSTGNYGISGSSEGDCGPAGSQISLSDEDTESEPHLGLLYEDESNPGLSLPPPPPPTYSDSIKPSNANSPIDSPSSENSNLPLPDNHPTLVTKNTILLCNWDYAVYQQFFEDEAAQGWSEPPTIPNPELEQNKAKFEKQRNSKVSLYDCLKAFSTPEVLGEQDLWYCPRCKDHRQATKSIQLWSTGDILTIHLKRFHSARAFSDKIDIVVDFPIEGLDMGPYIANPNSDNEIYDLIAVDNHYGGLGGGHYTACAKNFKDNKWYYFNDSRVTPMDDAKEAITGAAYLLFYRKRNTNETETLGGKNLNSILNTGRELYKKSLSNRKNLLEQVYSQVQGYEKYGSVIDEEAEPSSSESELHDQQEQEGVQAETVEASGEDKVESKKSRPFDNIDGEELKAQFNFDASDDLDYAQEDLDNIRKQRLISKENNNSKLIQIKGNGRQEVSSSPAPVDTSSVTDELEDKE